MKIKTKFLAGLFILFIIFSAFKLWQGDRVESILQQDLDIDLNMSDKVYEIVKTSCFDCHLSNSRNQKAKKALLFDRVSHLPPPKQISKLNDICEEVKDGTMPPEKYLENFPERKLTDAQIKAVCEWVGKESNKFLK